jgi:L,D-transpeptidase catalytic domain
MLTRSGIHILRKNSLLALCLFMTIAASAFSGVSNGYKPYPVIRSLILTGRNVITHETISRLKRKAIEARDYVSDKKFSEQYCFFIDMRLPSGKNRFFVYSLEKDAVVAAGLVSHGKGSEKGSYALVFSNTPNSLCTSLGKYKMGRSYQGMFGLSYKLYGLDRTNSNAFERNVVLHSYNGVPKQEVFPEPICVSEGCPQIAPDFLNQLKAYMDASDAPILLWIYN